MNYFENVIALVDFGSYDHNYFDYESSCFFDDRQVGALYSYQNLTRRYCTVANVFDWNSD